MIRIVRERMEIRRWSASSSKQQAAWDEFCGIDPQVMRQSFVTGLFDLARRMDMLPDDAAPQFGPTIGPKALAGLRRIKAARYFIFSGGSEWKSDRGANFSENYINW